MGDSYILRFKPNVGDVSHDQSAALFRDGELVTAGAEDRFTRNKYAIGEFPTNAIQWCLGVEEIISDDLDVIAVADNGRNNLERLRWSLPK